MKGFFRAITSPFAYVAVLCAALAAPALGANFDADWTALAPFMVLGAVSHIDQSDCDALNDIMYKFGPNFSPEIKKRIINTTPWIKLQRRGLYPDEMGLTISQMMFERALPSDDSEDWATVAASDGASTNACLPPTEVIGFGETVRNFALKHIAKQSPEICLVDVRTAWQMSRRLGNIRDALTTITRRVWENHNRNEYIATATYKVTERGTATNIEATSFAVGTPPTTPLSASTLKLIAQRLIDEGSAAIEGGTLGMANGAPRWGLITDMMSSEDLLRQDPTLLSVLQNQQGATNPLLAPLGVERSFGNFYHMYDDSLPRYDIVGGAWVRRQKYVSSATTKGNKWELNPLYVAAEYQDSVVYVPAVNRQLVPKTITNPGGDTKFDPVDYMGNFKWRNIPDKVCNPDGTIGFYRAVFSAATEPDHPELGYVIRHKRCGVVHNVVSQCRYS